MSSYSIKVTEYKDTVKIITNYSSSYINPQLFQFQSNANLNARDGDYRVYDNNNRTIVSGQYKSNNRIALWQYYFPMQNLKCSESFVSETLPLEFSYHDSNEPFSGQFRNKEKISGQTLNAVFYIKKGLIQKVIYTDPTTGKVVLKEKCKKGMAADGKPMRIYNPYR